MFPMNREMKLVLMILCYAKEKADGSLLRAPRFEGFSEVQIHYHIGLCSEAGFLHVNRHSMGLDHAPAYDIFNLTWNGHEFLTQNRD